MSSAAECQSQSRSAFQSTASQGRLGISARGQPPGAPPVLDVGEVLEHPAERHRGCCDRLAIPAASTPEHFHAKVARW